MSEFLSKSPLCLPKGFLLGVACAGIKKSVPTLRDDMALIYSEKDATTAGVFTTNRIKGAPVKLCMKRLKSSKGRAIIINSGNANTSVGKKGMKDAIEMARLTAQDLCIDERLVYVCSTGVIGVPLPMERIREKIPLLTKARGSATPLDVAKAIMTTDTFPKVSQRLIKVGRKTGRLLGICKGAGMIAPHMGTMLAFFLTDIAVEENALNMAFKSAVENSFNRITIDGDMSTSDTALIMANGMLGNKEIRIISPYYNSFRKALSSLTYELSRMIVKDGEGATKLIEIELRGAKTEAHALKAGFSVANSNLVKTAIYGEDPNWGRIMAALGSSGLPIKEEKIDIYFKGSYAPTIKVVEGGVSRGKESSLKKLLKGKEIKIFIDLNAGRAKTNILTCDLTEKYIRLNAHYRT